MGFDEIRKQDDRACGCIGGTDGGLNALNSLRTVGRALHAWVIPEQASIPQAWNAFDEEGNLKDDRLQERAMDIGRQVARFSYLHTSQKAQEFLQLWEGAYSNSLRLFKSQCWELLPLHLQILRFN